MLIFGHLGIGSKLASPWTKQLPASAVLVGTLLPDLIDKSLYYVPSILTGRHGAELGLISCTRTFGHTAIFLIAFTLLAVFRRSRVLAALAIGMATHLLLDNLNDSLSLYFASLRERVAAPERSALVALLFPFYQGAFSVAPFQDAGTHARHSVTPLTLGAELVGAAILAWDWWKRRHESEIMQLLQLRRHLRRERRHRFKHRSVD